MIIAVDFDGTCVKHEFPKVGADIGAVPVLKALVEAGHQLILWTMRSPRKEGAADEGTLGYANPQQIILETNVLQDAVDWFEKHNIPLFGINCNPNQHTWTDSPKVYAELVIDDTALGIPLLYEPGHRPYVDWSTVEVMLRQQGILPSIKRIVNPAIMSDAVVHISQENVWKAVAPQA